MVPSSSLIIKVKRTEYIPLYMSSEWSATTSNLIGPNEQ
jgi:hypothetical protein